MNIKAIILDLDDTLYPEYEFVISGFHAVADFVQSRYAIDSVKSFEILYQGYCKGERNNNIDMLYQELGIPYADILSTVEIYRNHKPRISLFSDAKEILEWLHQRKYPLALLTDGKAITQNNKIDALGIRNYFSIFSISDDFGEKYCKPDRRRYEYIKKEFAVSSSEILCVGDNVGKDFVAPNDLGMYTVRVVRQGIVHQNIEVSPGGNPEREISSLIEITSFLFT